MVIKPLPEAIAARLTLSLQPFRHRYGIYLEW